MCGIFRKIEKQSRDSRIRSPRSQYVEIREGAGNSVSCRVWAEPTNLAPQRFPASTASTAGARCATSIGRYGFINNLRAGIPAYGVPALFYALYRQLRPMRRKASTSPGMPTDCAATAGTLAITCPLSSTRTKPMVSPASTGASTCWGSSTSSDSCFS